MGLEVGPEGGQWAPVKGRANTEEKVEASIQTMLTSILLADSYGTPNGLVHEC